jgi:hypothetical protein
MGHHILVFAPIITIGKTIRKSGKNITKTEKKMVLVIFFPLFLIVFPIVIIGANTSIHPGVGDGNNLRLQSEEVIGGALSLDYQVVHLSVFRNDDMSDSRNYRSGRESRVRRASYRRSYRRREGL